MTLCVLSVIVTNARIRTSDPARPWATALGIADGKLAVMGSAAEILKMAAADPMIIDAKGAVVSLPAGVVIGSAVEVALGDGGLVALGRTGG